MPPTRRPVVPCLIGVLLGLCPWVEPAAEQDLSSRLQVENRDQQIQLNLQQQQYRAQLVPQPPPEVRDLQWRLAEQRRQQLALQLQQQRQAMILQQQAQTRPFAAPIPPPQHRLDQFRHQQRQQLQQFHWQRRGWPFPRR